MGQDDTWELLDESEAIPSAPQIGRRLTRRQTLLRAAGASLAVLVALTVIAGRFGYLDVTRDLWTNIRLAQTSTLAQAALAAHPMGRIQAGSWEKFPCLWRLTCSKTWSWRRRIQLRHMPAQPPRLWESQVSDPFAAFCSGVRCH
jgi:hypothetical protein